ncbi:hypothetical protein [Ferrimonas marina]|nr:hypothetical protein [Ferrimonas marina]
MQQLIDQVAATGDDHELAEGVVLVRGDRLIEAQSGWDQGDDSKELALNPAEVYWWGDHVVVADAEQLAECY